MPAGANAQTRHVQGAGPQAAARVIDIHCHMSVPEAADLVQPAFTPESEPALHFTSPASRQVNAAQAGCLKPLLTSPERKVEEMDRLGIDMQVLSPVPLQYYYWAEPDLGLAASRIINDRLAETVAAAPERFAALGTVPLQAPELAVQELRRCVRDLGLRGVEISSNVAGEELSHERFRPFFAAAEELGILIFLHPLGFTHGERLREHYFNNVIGNPLESTIAVSHLIFGGVLDRHPGLKICVAHGGGYLPAYAGRMDHAHRHRADCRGCRRQPSDYLRDLYFDTVVFDPEQVAYLVKRYGAGHVLLGSDHPFDMGDPDPVGLVKATDGLTPADLAGILGGNAAALLGLDRDEAGAAARSGATATGTD